jgi:hypothetical protein
MSLQRKFQTCTLTSKKKEKAIVTQIAPEIEKACAFVRILVEREDLEQHTCASSKQEGLGNAPQDRRYREQWSNDC